MARLKESIAWPNAPDRTSQINQSLADKYFRIHPDRIYRPPVNKYNIVGDRVEECKTLVVHEFSMGDVDDPDLYAAEPLLAWEKSDAGQWVMKNSADTPTWYRIADPMSYGYKYQIHAKLMGPALTEWLLKYGCK
jgi:hypothetical protein